MLVRAVGLAKSYRGAGGEPIPVLTGFYLFMGWIGCATWCDTTQMRTMARRMTLTSKMLNSTSMGSREVFAAYCGQATLARQCRHMLAEPGGRIRNPISTFAGFRSQAPPIWRARKSCTVCVDTSRVMKASPMPRARIKVSRPSRTFLS